MLRSSSTDGQWIPDVIFYIGWVFRKGFKTFEILINFNNLALEDLTNSKLLNNNILFKPVPYLLFDDYFYLLSFVVLSFYLLSFVVLQRSLTYTCFAIVSQSVTRPTATLDFQVTQVITNLWAAAIVQLTKIRHDTWKCGKDK